MRTDEPAARARRGRELRTQVPPEAHAALGATADRDPVRVLADQGASRVPELLPVRHARMSASPFAFFRGAAAVMAADLAGAPRSGLDVQLCGDAHLANFGLFASPERALLFDVNDFDETYRGPWEWDVQRLAASLVVAGRENGLGAKRTRTVVVAAVRRYRDALATFADLGNLALWRTRVDVAEAGTLLGEPLDARTAKRLDRSAAKARGRDHLRAQDRLTEVVDGRRRIVADPPLVVPVSDLAPGMGRDEVEARVEEILRDYAAGLPHGPRELLDQYTFVDMARKVVGVGSVGTRCWLVLMRGRDDDDPLFLQVKEAQESVLARHLGSAAHASQGERVVAGQRLVQAASDIFLGWTTTRGLDGRTRDFYVRQLHDWKGSADIARMSPDDLRRYAELCAWTLARAHARSGDRIALAAHLGDDDRFPQAIAEHAHAYANLTERDHAAFAAAVASGRLVGAAAGDA